MSQAARKAKAPIITAINKTKNILEVFVINQLSNGCEQRP